MVQEVSSLLICKVLHCGQWKVVVVLRLRGRKRKTEVDFGGHSCNCLIRPDPQFHIRYMLNYVMEHLPQELLLLIVSCKT